MGVAYFLLLSCLGVAITGQAQDCSSPVPGPNMNLRAQYINQQSFPSGSVVSFSCNVGYQASGGSASITCTSGTWTPVKLKCERKSCGPVGDVLNGQVQYIDGTEFGDKAVITCDAGYALVGKSELFCYDQGWSGRLPVCEVVKCYPPPQIVDGTYSPENDEYLYRDFVQYRCKDDYTLIGPKSTTCSEDGTFKPDPPRCAFFTTVIQCEDPAVDNADWIRRPPYRPGSTVTLQCRFGYVLKGEQTQTCDINGQWSPGLPTCELIQCEEPAVDNADWIRRPPYRPGSTVTLQCRSGYVLKGEQTQTCALNGQWSPGLPTCERGSEVITCTFGGWSPLMLKCQPLQCEDPAVDNDDCIRRPPYRPGSTVTLQCRSGYVLKGEQTQTCDINGQWSPGLPTCELVTCDHPPEIVDGTYSPDNEIDSNVMSRLWTMLTGLRVPTLGPGIKLSRSFKIQSKSTA